MWAKHQDVGGHEDRIAVEAHGDASVRVFAGLDVLVHRSLVGVGAVEQALGGDASQQPGQFRDLGNVGLAIERHAVHIQAAGQPSGGDFQARALDAQRVIALDQGVVVGQEVERIGVAVAAGEDRRTDGAGIIAQVRGAGGGDAGQDTGTRRHGLSLVRLLSIREARQEQILEIGQLAMKKVSAFCHFQQLMGALERVGPCVDQLRIDHFVGFRLDHGQLTARRQG